MEHELGGPFVPARVAVIAKTRSGKLKLRLVHDSRRSGANALVRQRERVVLPSVVDSVHIFLDLLEAGVLTPGPENEVENALADFLGAFTQCRSECHIRSRDPSNTICTQLFDHLLAGIAERLGASCWKCGMYTALCLSLAGDATAMKLLLGWRDLRAACYSNGR